MNELFSSENLIALLTLTSLEIVLGIDNVVFIAILVGKLPSAEQKGARRLGLLLALVSRILLLCCISYLMVLTEPLFTIMNHGLGGRDLILFVGGLFLIGKATYEIHERVEGGSHGENQGAGTKSSYAKVLFQIMLIDIVFSLDSVITAVGMAQHLGVMIIAVILAVLVMLVFAETISKFIDRHPTLKVLALSFLLLIGVMLVAEAFHVHVDKGYIYFAMAFSLLVESINIRSIHGKKAKDVAH